MSVREKKKRCYSCSYFAYVNSESLCEDCERKEKKREKGTGDQDEGSPRSTTHDCGRCSVRVKNNDNAMKCDECHCWFHIGCEKVSKALYEVMKENKELMWFCSRCRPQIRRNAQEVQKLRSQNQSLTEELEMEKRENKEIREMLKNLQEENKGLLGRVKALERGWAEKENKIIEKTWEKVEERLEEWEEKKSRRNNIMIFHMKESDKRDGEEREKDDLEACEEIIRESLGLDNIQIEKVLRMGKKVDGKRRALQVRLASEKQKWAVVSKAKALRNERDEEKKKIGISPDLTKREREESLALRRLLHERRAEGGQWKIIRGRVVEVERD